MMHSHDPVSMLALYHVEHSALVSQACEARRRRALRTGLHLRTRARRVYYRVLRTARAYRHALSMASRTAP